MKGKHNEYEEEPTGPMNQQLFRVKPIGSATNVMETVEQRLNTPKMDAYRYAITRLWVQGAFLWIETLGMWGRQNIERVLGKRITSQNGKDDLPSGTGWHNVAYKVQGPLFKQEVAEWALKRTANAGDLIRLNAGMFKGERARVLSTEIDGRLKVELIDVDIMIDLLIQTWETI